MHDIAVSPSYDLIPNGAGGLTEVDGLATDLQDVNYRVLTNNQDHLLWPLGANLEDLIGQPNTAATGALGEASIVKALTYDGRFGQNAVQVSGVPISANEIEFAVGLVSAMYRTSAAVLTTVVELESPTT